MALNVYPVIGHRWPWKRSYYWTTPHQRTHHLQPIVERLRDSPRPVWVSELQAEPWEPGRLVYTESAHPPTSHPDMLSTYVREMQELGVTTVFFWGAEYWHYRRTQQDDPSWWEAVKRLLEAPSTS